MASRTLAKILIESRLVLNFAHRESLKTFLTNLQKIDIDSLSLHCNFITNFKSSPSCFTCSESLNSTPTTTPFLSDNLLSQYSKDQKASWKNLKSITASADSVTFTMNTAALEESKPQLSLKKLTSSFVLTTLKLNPNTLP